MGRFTLRLPETLHHELENRAQQEGVSLNQFIVYALTRQVTPKYTIQLLPDDQIAQQQTRYEQLIVSLGEATDAEVVSALDAREAAAPDEALALEMVTLLREKIAAYRTGG